MKVTQWSWSLSILQLAKCLYWGANQFPFPQSYFKVSWMWINFLSRKKKIAFKTFWRKISGRTAPAIQKESSNSSAVSSSNWGRWSQFTPKIKLQFPTYARSTDSIGISIGLRKYFTLPALLHLKNTNKMNKI